MVVYAVVIYGGSCIYVATGNCRYVETAGFLPSSEC